MGLSTRHPCPAVDCRHGSIQLAELRPWSCGFCRGCGWVSRRLLLTHAALLRRLRDRHRRTGLSPYLDQPETSYRVQRDLLLGALASPLPPTC